MAAGGQAELIYVQGPQAGQRASLMLPVVTVGRGQQADIQLTEEHVSRKHFQITLTQDGWVFENTSPLRSRVNGKKYKAGKKIILDTGDVIGVGVETEFLFVATGDDPEAALIAYRQDGAKKSTPRTAVATPSPDPPGQAGDDQQPGALEQIEGARPAQTPEDEEEDEPDEEELAILAQKAKFKKYATIFGIYIGVLAVVVILIVSMGDRPGEAPEKGQAPKLLNNDQIEEYIEVALNRDNNSVEARNALEKAIEELDRTNAVDHLWRSIYHFKLSQAYGKVLNTKDETLFKSAKRRLTKHVQGEYRNAYLHQGDGKYGTADYIYRRLLKILPVIGRRNETDELRKNIIYHMDYVKYLYAKSKKK
jgi:hypothetical protein